MSLETTAGDAKMKLSTPNEEDDSDYDSMFGDDNSSDDEEEQEKVPSPSSSTSIVQVTTEKEGIEDDDNLKEYKNENQRQQLDNNNCAPILNISKSNQSKKIPRKNAALSSSGSNNNSIRKKRKLSPSTLSKLSSSQYGGGGSLSHDTTTSPSFDIDTYNYSPSFDDFGSSVLTTDKALVSASTSASSSASVSVSRTTNGSSSSSSIVTHKNPKQQIPLLRPDQYPSFDMDEFWRTFRAWNFIHDLNQSIKKQQQQHQQENKEKLEPPLPEDFHCHEQYVALWSPLLLREIKAQIISDVTSLKSSSVPLSKFAQSVNVTVKNSGSSRSGEENYSDFLTLNISAPAQDPAGGKGGGQRYGGGGGGAQGRNAKMVQHHASRNEFVQNEMVLLITEPSFLDQACKGSLKVDSSAESGKKSSYCMMTLLSNASQFAKGRLGVVGIVKQRSKSLKSGLIVQISKRLLKSSAPETFGSCLLRLGHCVTAIREFKALCNVNEMPLMKYLLSPKEHSDKIASVSSYKKALSADPLSEYGGRNALGIGFRIWVKSKFNHSQQEAINGAAREYGSGGFSLVKGPPGTGKTTTLSALVNALHLRQYQRYFSEIERITLSLKTSNQTETLAAIAAAARVKPRILICAPSNAAVDNIIIKIVEDRFMDGNGGKYKPSLVRVGAAYSSSVSNVTLDYKVNEISAEGSKPKALEESIVTLRKDLRWLENEIENLQRRIRLIANASTYLLSRDWEIRVDEQNFKSRKRVLFVNHKSKKVQLKCPPRPQEGEDLYPTSEMPHYRSCMTSLVKLIERHNDKHSKLMQLTLVQNAASSVDTSNYNKVGVELNQEIETHVLNSTHIVFTTLGSSGSKTMENVVKFSVIVIDEAAQSSEPSILPALQLGSSHCVLVGDPQQLPATIFSMSGRETKFDRSLFQRLEEGGHPVNMLNTQYRMNPKISAFPRQIFYDGSLLDGPNVTKPDFGGELNQAVQSKFPYFQPLTVLDLDSSEEREGTNLSNIDEARLALHLFCSLEHETNGISKKSKVAIITPYMQQVFVIKRLFEDRYGLSYNRMVDISTIDAFQGKEANIVILSCVRAASRSVGIGFLSDVQRMNVALTRAKHFLFVIARCRTILVNPYWRDFVAHARKQQAILRIVPRKNNQDMGRMMGRKNNGSSATIEKSFPNLRYVKPIHHHEGASTTRPGRVMGHMRKNSYQGEDDGNISA